MRLSISLRLGCMSLDPAMMITFEAVIREMDSKYLKWIDRESELQRKQAEASGSRSKNPHRR